MSITNVAIIDARHFRIEDERYGSLYDGMLVDESSKGCGYTEIDDMFGEEIRHNSV